MKETFAKSLYGLADLIDLGCKTAVIVTVAALSVKSVFGKASSIKVEVN